MLLPILVCVAFCNPVAGRLRGDQNKKPAVHKGSDPAEPTVQQSLDEAQRELDKAVPGLKLSDMPGVRASVDWAKQFTVQFTSDTVIGLDLDNVTIREALKKVFETVKSPYSIEERALPNTRITLHVPSVKVSTALDMITQCGPDLNWTREIHEESSGRTTLFYRVGRAPKGVMMSVFSSTGVGQSIPTFINSSTGNMNDMAAKLWSISIPQRRLVFRCPHCHNKIVMSQENRAVGLPGGARAHRTLQPPTAKWRFCPVCGKEIDIEAIQAARSAPVAERALAAEAQQAARDSVRSPRSVPRDTAVPDGQ